jgi:hypothetical protein
MIQLLLATAAALTIEDYATMPQPSSPRWSPDGAHMAFVVCSGTLRKTNAKS